MSEEWGDMIWIGISMIIGAVLLSMLFFFNGIGHDLTSAVYQEEADARALQETRVTLPYDEAKNLSGAEVLSAMMDMADRDVYTFVAPKDVSGQVFICGPIGSDLATAQKMLKLMTPPKDETSGTEKDLSAFAKITDEKKYFLTPQTQDIAGLFDKFDKLYLSHSSLHITHQIYH